MAPRSAAMAKRLGTPVGIQKEFVPRSKGLKSIEETEETEETVET
jgi:hypothetical protein